MLVHISEVGPAVGRAWGPTTPPQIVVPENRACRRTASSRRRAEARSIQIRLVGLGAGARSKNTVP